MLLHLVSDVGTSSVCAEHLRNLIALQQLGEHEHLQRIGIQCYRVVEEFHHVVRQFLELFLGVFCTMRAVDLAIGYFLELGLHTQFCKTDQVESRMELASMYISEYGEPLYALEHSSNHVHVGFYIILQDQFIIDLVQSVVDRLTGQAISDDSSLLVFLPVREIHTIDRDVTVERQPNLPQEGIVHSQ